MTSPRTTRSSSAPDAGETASPPADESPPAPVPGTSAPRLLVAVLLLVVTLAGIGVITLGASADRGPGAVYDGATEASYLWGQQREPYSEPDWSTSDVPTEPPDPEGPNIALIIIVTVIAAVLLALTLWVAHRMRRLARPAPAIAREADADELTVTQARSALDDARERLSTVVDAQDAVIAAWLALERTIADAGVHRARSQTTLEFVVAVLGRLDLDRTALELLAHLYRRALFDPQPLQESDREDALALLQELTTQLEDEDGAGATDAP